MTTLDHVTGGRGLTGVPPLDMLPEAGSLWLLRLLRDLQLAQFYRPILEELNVTRPEHFDFVRAEDLDGIGMGRPGESPLPLGPTVSFPSLLVATLLQPPHTPAFFLLVNPLHPAPCRPHYPIPLILASLSPT